MDELIKRHNRELDGAFKMIREQKLEQFICLVEKSENNIENIDMIVEMDKFEKKHLLKPVKL